MDNYEDTRRVTYAAERDGTAVFVPVCSECGKYVKADDSIFTGEAGLSPEPNATCATYGRVHMLFEGFI